MDGAIGKQLYALDGHREAQIHTDASGVVIQFDDVGGYRKDVEALFSEKVFVDIAGPVAAAVAAGDRDLCLASLCSPDSVAGYAIRRLADGIGVVTAPQCAS